MNRGVDKKRLIEHRARVRADLEPYLSRGRRPSRPPEVIITPADTGRAARAARTLYRWLSGRGTPERSQLEVRALHDDCLECFWQRNVRLRGRTAIVTSYDRGDRRVVTARIRYERIRRADLTGGDKQGCRAWRSNTA